MSLSNMYEEGYIPPSIPDLIKMSDELGIDVDRLSSIYDLVREGIEHKQLEGILLSDTKYGIYIAEELESASNPTEAIFNGIRRAYYEEPEDEEDGDDGEDSDEEADKEKDSDDKKIPKKASRSKEANYKKGKHAIDWPDWHGLNYDEIARFKSKLKAIKPLQRQEAIETIANPEGFYTGIRYVRNEEEALEVFLDSTEEKYERLMNLVDEDGMVEYQYDKTFNPITIILFIDDSGSMRANLNKLYGGMEYFIRQHTDNLIKLVIVTFESIIYNVFDCTTMQAKNSKTPLLQQMKDLWKLPSGGNTDLGRVIKEWQKIEHQYLTPLQIDNKEYIIINDGEDDMPGEFPTKVHGISFEQNDEIEAKCKKSGGTYSVFY